MEFQASAVLALALSLCAVASGVVFREDAKATVYQDLVCQLPNGSGGVCRPAGDCSASPARPCTGRGLVCCPTPGSQPPAAGVGNSAKRECQRSADLAKASECPPFELIPGKNTAVPGLFPYLAVLGYGNLSDSRWLCAGVLVSESYVLTSAVCLGNPLIGLVKRARLGDVDLTSVDDDETVQLLEVDEVYPHPLYRPRSRYHDLALLHLHTPAKLSATVRPACLNLLPQLPTSHLITAGFGAESGFGSDFGKARYVDITEVPAEQCQKALPQLSKIGVKINESMICAGDEAGGRDSCKGDSGGPLQVRLDAPHCQFSVVGLTSFGTLACGEAGKPSVYTRLSEYIPWIESIVWP